MPWLAATAFLHSVMVQERKGMLKVWNMVLVALAFELSVFGTFLTRSGVVNSIHSFAKSSIGPLVPGLRRHLVGVSLALIMWRLPLLKAKTKLESALSREAAFLYNNLLLVALCLTILWGVLWPIVTQLVKGETRTMGRPYYDFFLRTFGLPLLLLMGIGPLIAWRKTSLRGLTQTLAWPVGAAVVTGVVLAAVGAGSSKAGPDRVHVLGVRARDDHGRARARHARDGIALPARRAQPASLRRLRRPRRDRLARDRDRRLECVLELRRAPARSRPVDDRGRATR